MVVADGSLDLAAGCHEALGCTGDVHPLWVVHITIRAMHSSNVHGHLSAQSKCTVPNYYICVPRALKASIKCTLNVQFKFSRSLASRSTHCAHKEYNMPD